MPRKVETVTLKISHGKGVLGKDGTPFAADTLHVVHGGMNIPIPCTFQGLFASILNPKVTEIQLIDADNHEFVITK